MCFYTLSHLASPIPLNVEGHSIILIGEESGAQGGELNGQATLKSWGQAERHTWAVSFLIWATLLPKFGGKRPSKLLRVPSQPCL